MANKVGRPSSGTYERVNFQATQDQMAQLRAIQARVGISLAMQIRRAIDLWIESQDQSAKRLRA
jgi:hypothetical protein